MWLIKIQSATGTNVLRFMGMKFPSGKELGDLTNPFTGKPTHRMTAKEAKAMRERENDELAARFAKRYFGLEITPPTIN